MEYTDSFIPMRVKDGGFFQSEEWSHFQESAGCPSIYVANENFAGRGFFHTLPLVGRYLYFPRGPISVSSHEKNSEATLRILKELGEKEGVEWIRIEPQYEHEARSYLSDGSVRKSLKDTQPKEIFTLDISLSEEELLSRMKQKTRYNIRLAEKKGVKVIVSRENKYKEAFLQLIVKTADRKIITPHPRSYYEKFFSAFPEEMMYLFVAVYENEVVAANLVALYGKTAYYLHGGSSDSHRDVMAPYLLQWEQIKFVKNKGALVYDFGGIKTGEKNEKNTWAGITRFKQGFDPKRESTFFPGAYDIVINKKRYFFYTLLQHAKKILKLLKY